MTTHKLAVGTAATGPRRRLNAGDGGGAPDPTTPRPRALIKGARAAAPPTNHQAEDRPLTAADITDAATRYHAHLPQRNTRPRRPGQGFATWISPDIYLTVTSSQTGLWVRYTQVTDGRDTWDRWRLPQEWARSGHVPWKRVEAAAAKASERKTPAADAHQLAITEVTQ